MKICETRGWHRREKSVFSFLSTTIGSFCFVKRPKECLQAFFLLFAATKKKTRSWCLLTEAYFFSLSLYAELANKKRRRESVSTFLQTPFSTPQPFFYPFPPKKKRCRNHFHYLPFAIFESFFLCYFRIKISR